MKIVSHTKYGPPKELKIVEIEKPVPGNKEVLVKIHATSVTTSDCNVRNFTFAPDSFKPMAKLYFGIFKPRNNKLGVEFAGVVESVGEKVKLFKPGDEIFGSTEMTLGAHAEYICMPERGVMVEKPSNISFEEAAVISLAANTALFFIRDLGKTGEGQKILIHGASGGIGTFAVQLAKYYGAHVTGVCSGTNVEMVKSLGADKVIDYTKEDFTETGDTYDIVFSVVGKTKFSKCKKIINPGGIYLENWLEFWDIFRALWFSFFGKIKFKGGVAVDKIENLTFLKELVEKGVLKPVVDKTYKLDEIVEAFEYVEKGHKKGNVAVIV